MYTIVFIDDETHIVGVTDDLRHLVVRGHEVRYMSWSWDSYEEAAAFLGWA